MREVGGNFSILLHDWWQWWMGGGGRLTVMAILVCVCMYICSHATILVGHERRKICLAYIVININIIQCEIRYICWWRTTRFTCILQELINQAINLIEEISGKSTYLIKLIYSVCIVIFKSFEDRMHVRSSRTQCKAAMQKYNILMLYTAFNVVQSCCLALHKRARAHVSLQHCRQKKRSRRSLYILYITYSQREREKILPVFCRLTYSPREHTYMCIYYKCESIMIHLQPERACQCSIIHSRRIGYQSEKRAIPLFPPTYTYSHRERERTIRWWRRWFGERPSPLPFNLLFSRHARTAIYNSSLFLYRSSIFYVSLFRKFHRARWYNNVGAACFLFYIITRTDARVSVAKLL